MTICACREPSASALNRYCRTFRTLSSAASPAVPIAAPSFAALRATNTSSISPSRDIDHSRTKTKSPQTNGICERFHRTVLDEFYRVAFRNKIYRTIEELQADLDAWLVEYNHRRPHQGRWCFGNTPMQTFLDTLPLAKEKLMAA